jgi:hypothetical protein
MAGGQGKTSLQCGEVCSAASEIPEFIKNCPSPPRKHEYALEKRFEVVIVSKLFTLKG